MLSEIRFDIWSILILFGAFHGLYLGIMLLLKKENKRANRLFAFIVLVFTLHLIETASWITGLIKVFPHLSKTTYPILFLMGPLLWYYAQSLKGKAGFSLKHALHLLPAIAVLAWMSPYYFLDATIKLRELNVPPPDTSVNFELSGYIFGAAFYAYNITYIILVYRSINSLIERNSLSKKLTQRTRWFSKVLIAYALFIGSCMIFFLIMALTGSYPLYYDYIHIFLMALMIHVVGYFVINQPALFVDTLKRSGEQKYHKSSLPYELSKRYINDLYTYMDNENPYLRDNLTLSDVADGAGLSKHHLSLVLNKEIGLTFYDFISKYRVAEAKKLIEEGKDGSLKLIDIGFQAGFGNKVSFYRAFKKFEGASPSEYMESIRIKPEA